MNDRPSEARFIRPGDLVPLPGADGQLRAVIDARDAGPGGLVWLVVSGDHEIKVWRRSLVQRVRLTPSQVRHLTAAARRELRQWGWAHPVFADGARGSRATLDNLIALGLVWARRDTLPIGRIVPTPLGLTVLDALNIAHLGPDPSVTYRTNPTEGDTDMAKPWLRTDAASVSNRDQVDAKVDSGNYAPKMGPKGIPIIVRTEQGAKNGAPLSESQRDAHGL